MESASNKALADVSPKSMATSIKVPPYLRRDAAACVNAEVPTITSAKYSNARENVPTTKMVPDKNASQTAKT